MRRIRRCMIGIDMDGGHGESSGRDHGLEEGSMEM